MSEKIEILTPVGRLVTGSPFQENRTDAEGNPLVIKNGPNAGQPRVEYFMGIAIPKTDPSWPQFHAKILQSAKASFPNLFDAQGKCLSPKFAFKITDGDSQVPNSRGNKPCDHEGFPGNWIVNFSGGFAPKCYSKGGESILTDPESIKKGYYIRIYGSVTGNGSTQQPGVFLNPQMVELVAYGEEIVTGPSGEAIFGGTPAASIPAGASATPPAPAAPIAPAPDFVANAGATAPPPVPPAPAPAAEPTYMVSGHQYTKTQLMANGWTDEQIKSLDRLPF